MTASERNTGKKADGPGAGSPGKAAERCLVLHPAFRSGPSSPRDSEARLSEAVGLAEAIDLAVVDSRVLRANRPRPGTLIGKGAVEELARFIADRSVALCIIDHALTPIQQRNLERAWSCKVIDRTGLILEIFGERARTKEGQLQVELAALSYQRSRLVRSWTHLERQRGGFGFLGGPGESQLEIDRRLTSDRISRIRTELATVKRTRALHRQARKRVPYPVIALVGYTNAGKSTLFNRLTGARVMAKKMLFATLDPTMRKIRLDSDHEAILSDTVGFISELPTGLVAAFRATLEEVSEADLILHVRDAAHADTEAQRRDVEAVLEDLGLTAEGSQRIEVLNKLDLLDPDERAAVVDRAARTPDQIAISAVTGEGLDQLLLLLSNAVNGHRCLVDLWIPHQDGAALSWLYERGKVLERSDDEEGCSLKVSLEPAVLSRFEQRFGIAARESLDDRLTASPS